jgi:hypothetical protein
MAKKYTSQKSVLEALEEKGSIVLAEIKADEKLSSYLTNINFMKQAVKIMPEIIASTNLETARELLRENGTLLKLAKSEVKQDGLAVFIAITNTPEAILDADKQFLNSEEHAFEAVKGNYKLLKEVNAKFKKREKFASVSLDQSLEAKDYIGKNLVYNNETMLIRLIKETKFEKKDFKKFNKGMLASTEVCSRLAENYAKDFPEVVKLFRGKAKKDELIGLVSISQNAKTYKHLHSSLKKNDSINIAFVQRYPDKYKMLGKQLYRPYVAMALVSQNGLLLKKFRNSYLADEKNVVKAALLSNGAALKFAAKVFYKDDELVLTALQNFKAPQPKLDKNGNKIPVKNPLKNHPLRVAHKKYRKDLGHMMESVKVAPLSIQFGAKSAKADADIGLESVSGDGRARAYLSKKIKNSDDIVLASLCSEKGFMEAYEGLSKRYVNKPKNHHILIDALTEHPELYHMYPDAVKQNKQAILLVADKFPEAANNLQLEDKQDKSVLRELANLNVEAYHVAVNDSYKVQSDKKFMQEMDKVVENLKSKQGKQKQNSKQLDKNSNKDYDNERSM